MTPDNQPEDRSMPSSTPALQGELQDSPSTAVAEYSQTAAALASLRQELQGKTWNLATVAGNTEARQSRMALVKLRTTLDARRKELNTDDQARIAARNEEAKRITGQILELESPIDEAIKADETRREAERQARERAEAERLQAINDKIEAIRQLPLQHVSSAVDVIEQEIVQLGAMTFEGFDEIHEPRARAARDQAIDQLVASALARKEADAQREANRVERERLAAERKADAQAERARQAEADRIQGEQAERQRELDMQAAFLREQQEAIEAGQREAREAEQKRERKLRDDEEAAAAEEGRRIQEQRRAEEARAETEMLANVRLEEAVQEAIDALRADRGEDDLTARKLWAAWQRYLYGNDVTAAAAPAPKKNKRVKAKP